MSWSGCDWQQTFQQSLIVTALSKNRGFFFHRRCLSTRANGRFRVQLLMLLSKFTKYCHRTAGLRVFAQGHQGSRTGSSPVFMRWSKTRATRRKTSLNSSPRLSLKPFILIPVDTCYFFDGKYKAVQHQTGLWYESTNLNQIYSRCSAAIWAYSWVLLGSGGMLWVQNWG